MEAASTKLVLNRQLSGQLQGGEQQVSYRHVGEQAWWAVTMRGMAMLQ
jgi:hypothetical protein